ncbi:hypothetical protein OS493_001016 [Desmophyllum pertusum]|uniref:G-protein coupled receptors family 1 profile domain-containing protein n=1 Tax=Desmophyllum pertusum TaxID=174260 RepID=A0A9W9ZTL1_9CNID|nr:hypothetical protein OS493_001016 [Desmophyllum pertusum]
MQYYMFYEGYLLKVSFPLAVVFIVFGLYTVVGNTLVCTVYFIDPFKNLRTLSFYYVVNLAFADILVGVFVEPLNVSVYWTDSEPALFAFYVFAVVSCVSSILNISAMMLDRYIAVSQAFRYRVLVTVKRVRLSVVFMWLYAFHFSLLALLGWRDSSFQIYLYGFGVLLPSVIMLVSYYGLIRILKEKGAKVRRFSSGLCTKSTQVKKMVQRERRVSTTVLIMLMVFLVAWFPFVVVDFVLVFCAHCRSKRLLLARDITLSMGFFSSGINPALYAWRVRRFKQGLLKIMKLGASANMKMVPRRLSRVRPVSASKFSPVVIVELDRLPPHNLENDIYQGVTGKIDWVDESVAFSRTKSVIHS